MTRRLNGLKSVISCVLAAALMMPAAGAQDSGPKTLNLVIVEGEGSINNLRNRVAREPIVQVEDENRKPVSGALVTFMLPNSGPGASFPNGAQSLTVVSDANGRAVARGLRTNNLEGQYQIRITAQLGERSASAAIGMSNSLAAAAATGAGIGAGKLLLILGIVGGAAAAGGIVYATTTSGPSPAHPPVTVTPGTPSVGAPR